MTIHLETERTYMRSIEKEDAKNFFDLDSDPEVHRFLGNKPVTHIQQSREIILYILDQYQKYGIGRWAVINKETDEFMGWSGLKFETKLRSNTHYYDLGYRFKKKFWGQGFGTETALASLEYGFSRMELEEISAAADVENAASNAILKKIGMRYVEDFYYKSTRCHFYTIRQKDWNSRS